MAELKDRAEAIIAVLDGSTDGVLDLDEIRGCIADMAGAIARESGGLAAVCGTLRELVTGEIRRMRRSICALKGNAATQEVDIVEISKLDASELVAAYRSAQADLGRLTTRNRKAADFKSSSDLKAYRTGASSLP